MRFCSSGGMPGPLSRTSTRTRSSTKRAATSIRPPSGVNLMALPSRFMSTCLNLVGNAIKFTPDGGRIEVAARLVEDKVRVEVRDNGPGIPPEEQQRIFEAFYRLRESGRKTEGTG